MKKYLILFSLMAILATSCSEHKNSDGPITINIYYTGENGNARSFAEEMTASGIVAEIRAEEGNMAYEYFFPADDPETVLLIDRWRDQKSLDIHHATPMMEKIAALREKYDLHMRVNAMSQPTRQDWMRNLHENDMRKIFSTIALMFSIMANGQKVQLATKGSNIEIKQTAGRQQLGEFAPEFAHLNDDVLFCEVWNRNDKLSLRDRSIVTVVALMAWWC